MPQTLMPWRGSLPKSDSEFVMSQVATQSGRANVQSDRSQVGEPGSSCGFGCSKFGFSIMFDVLFTYC